MVKQFDLKKPSGANELQNQPNMLSSFQLTFRTNDQEEHSFSKQTFNGMVLCGDFWKHMERFAGFFIASRYSRFHVVDVDSVLRISRDVFTCSISLSHLIID